MRQDRLVHLVARAVQRRAPLALDQDTTAYRLLNGAADGVPGTTVDRYGAALIINLYDEADSRDVQALVDALVDIVDTRAVYVKRRPTSAARLSTAQVATLAPSFPACGTPLDEEIVLERGLRFLIRPGGGFSVGLYLDMREARGRLRARVAGRTVLNLFAYTCAFGVAACAGGARRVLNLDASRPALQWGMENYGLNELDVDPYDFVHGDAFDWLNRIARREQSFDVVIADPPSFSTVKGRRFDASRDYTRLATACARVTAPGGLLLCCSNEASLPRETFHAACLRGVREAGHAARVDSYDRAPDLDFPRLPGDDGHLKLLWLVISD